MSSPACALPAPTGQRGAFEIGVSIEGIDHEAFLLTESPRGELWCRFSKDAACGPPARFFGDLFNSGERLLTFEVGGAPVRTVRFLNDEEEACYSSDGHAVLFKTDEALIDFVVCDDMDGDGNYVDGTTDTWTVLLRLASMYDPNMDPPWSRDQGRAEGWVWPGANELALDGLAVRAEAGRMLRA